MSKFFDILYRLTLSVREKTGISPKKVDKKQYMLNILYTRKEHHAFSLESDTPFKLARSAISVLKNGLPRCCIKAVQSPACVRDLLIAKKSLQHRGKRKPYRPLGYFATTSAIIFFQSANTSFALTPFASHSEAQASKSLS